MNNLQSNIAAFQTAVSAMWDSFTKLSRLVQAEADVPFEKMVLAMSLYNETYDLMVKAGAPLQALAGEVSIDKAVLADDVASIQFSTFCASVRQDETFRSQIRAGATTAASHYAQLPGLDADAVHGDVFDALWPAAQALQVNFTNVVEQLSPCGAV